MREAKRDDFFFSFLFFSLSPPLFFFFFPSLQTEPTRADPSRGRGERRDETRMMRRRNVYRVHYEEEEARRTLHETNMCVHYRNKLMKMLFFFFFLFFRFYSLQKINLMRFFFLFFFLS